MLAKQNTAKSFLFGPILDADGVAKTDEVVASIKVSKNGTVGAPNGASTLTHNHTGHYVYAANAGDLDTLGEVEFSLNSGTNAAATVKFQVLPANVYDSLVSGSDLLDVSLGNAAMGGTSLVLTLGRLVVSANVDSGGAVDINNAGTGTGIDVDTIGNGITIFSSGAKGLDCTGGVGAGASFVGVGAGNAGIYIQGTQSGLDCTSPAGWAAYFHGVIDTEGVINVVNAGLGSGINIATVGSNVGDGITINSTNGKGIQSTGNAGGACFIGTGPGTAGIYCQGVEAGLDCYSVAGSGVYIHAGDGVGVWAKEGILIAAEGAGILVSSINGDAVTLTPGGAGVALNAANIEAIQTSVDALGPGTGARTVTITVDDGTDPLESVKVRVTKGAESYTQSTNVSGVAVFNLDDGSWTVALTLSGYTYAGTTLVVDGTETPTYSMTQVTFPASDPGLITGYLYCYDEDGVVEAGVIVQMRFYGLDGTGVSYDKAIRSETSDVAGLVSFTNLFQGAAYQIRRGTDGPWIKVTIPAAAADPYALDDVAGEDD